MSLREQIASAYAVPPHLPGHVCHIFPRPPGPGDRAYCGILWTREGAEECSRHAAGQAPQCHACRVALDLRLGRRQ